MLNAQQTIAVCLSLIWSGILGSGIALGSGQAEPNSRAVSASALESTDRTSRVDSSISADEPRMSPLMCGFVPPMVKEGKIKLPIDSRVEANAIAEAWLDAVGDATLVLGEMLKVRRAYLLSVIDRDDPNLERHQIVIAAKDGRVSVL